LLGDQSTEHIILPAMNRSAEELRRWAHEHLVYEAAMLLHAVKKAADERLSDTDRNAFIESFAIHVRCLRDFLWRDERAKPEDALASDFCLPDAWEAARGELPEALQEIEGERNRIGREIVHLTYHRLDIEAESKNWNMGELLEVIADALARFSELADPERLAEQTRGALALMPKVIQPDPQAKPLVITQNVPGVTGATQMIQPTQVTGGTIPFPGFTAGEIERDPPS
jgi:hypothetical protein